MPTCVGAADKGLGVDAAAAARWLPPFGFRPYRLHQSLVRLDRNSVLHGSEWPEAKALCLSQLGLDLLIAEQVRFYHQIAGSEKLFAASPSIGIPDLCPFHRQPRPCLISTNIQRRSSHAITA
ncbi:hypothetical protein PANT_7c00004 [Moesziomyces antarcticus T-34]|uniref:Uncharacterized protein n=1 Tax=Pseudozyma antarctica (strain T-34) TaxID=1151754 RepID=M9MB74_PSEA3|nr:hypothetical protein PANT_7c00004 [Moesziomyces antarcticus T-34]